MTASEIMVKVNRGELSIDDARRWFADNLVAGYNPYTGQIHKVDCQNELSVTITSSGGKKKIPIQPEPPRAPITDDEREAKLRKAWEGFLDKGRIGNPSDNVAFLLRRLDELRVSIAPAPVPAHDWIARLNGPFVPPA